MGEEKSRVKLFKAVYSVFIGSLVLLLVILCVALLGFLGVIFFYSWEAIVSAVILSGVSLFLIYLWFKFNEWGFKVQKQIRKKNESERTWLDERILKTSFEDEVEIWRGTKKTWRGFFESCRSWKQKYI